MEDRLVNIEIKLTNQEQLIEELSAIIYKQQIQIDKLERAAIELERFTQHDIGQHNVKPPHY